MGNRQGKLSRKEKGTLNRFVDKLSVARSRSRGPDKNGKLAEPPSLGILRLDYDYPSAPGLTFAKCQEGTMTDKLEREIKKAIRWLTDVKKVSAITGDCGFMFWYQPCARQYTDKPVFLSSLTQLPAITSAYSDNQKIAIFTANGKTLMPMASLISKECGVSLEAMRHLMIGCQDVPGFEAVELGEKVDTAKVQPGIVALAIQVIKDNPDVKAILFECTELPPYSDAVREATGLPVFDSITCADMFMDGLLDNPRFGLNNWQKMFDGIQEKYKLGVHLSIHDQIKCTHCGAVLLDASDDVLPSDDEYHDALDAFREEDF